ncbi:hypothetical protein BDU57DRAFT_598711 [Ampelomyces quisqualis]|uniref:RING-type domain-containing protein n=1 Tax=Ampelomyces quisqualis TaxID=50730 RepID=A0A6A5Q9B9_AMPQU|nr:hypothetical protein BDU57DRAFT_598711 [Ampelomyces quisqualis]
MSASHHPIRGATIPSPLVCPICLDNLPPPAATDPAVTVTPCGHVFGKHCLATWMREHNTCPVCRDEVAPNRSHDTGSRPRHFALGAYATAGPDFDVAMRSGRRNAVRDGSVKVRDSNAADEDRGRCTQRTVRGTRCYYA